MNPFEADVDAALEVDEIGDVDKSPDEPGEMAGEAEFADFCNSSAFADGS
ncbi:MAG: hypothetical protein S4CHLAM102_11350 [Chlamydiia bacterium]|nr:hypothetical protein [Chlamydiia bacterium]